MVAPATAIGADAGPPPAKPANEVTTDLGAELATPPDSCEAHPDADGAAVPAAVATAVVADLAHAKDVAINWPVLLDGGTNGAFCALGPILRHQRR
jgi:hypothetical protein